MINARKERDRAVKLANPNLDGAGVEVEGAFLVDLGSGIGGGKNFGANFWGALEQGELRDALLALGSEPGDIDGSDACRSGYGALRQGAAVGEKLPQKEGNFDLALAVERSGRRNHEYAAVLIGLDAIRELRELRISENFLPASEVKARLRFEVRELNRNRHAGKIRQKWKKA
jgi:hypothetical protein